MDEVSMTPNQKQSIQKSESAGGSGGRPYTRGSDYHSSGKNTEFAICFFCKMLVVIYRRYLNIGKLAHFHSI